MLLGVGGRRTTDGHVCDTDGVHTDETVLQPERGRDVIRNADGDADVVAVDTDHSGRRGPADVRRHADLRVNLHDGDTN